MARTEELQVLHVRDLHKAGLYLDVGPASNDIPLQGFQACLNTRFRRGRLEVVPGWAQFGSNGLDSRVMYADQYFKQDGTDFLIAVSETSPWKYNTSTGAWEQITAGLFTGGVDDIFDSDTGFDTFVITNNKDRVQKWTGTGDFVDLAGLDDAFPGGTDVSQAKIIRFINGFAVALGTSEDGFDIPQRVRWGKQGFLEVWKNDADGNGQAGFYDLLDSPDWILGAEVLSGSLLIMKERSFYLMQYVGLPTIWYFRKVISGVGLVGPKAYVTLGDEIAFLGQDNFYVFGGYNIQVIGDNKIKTEFFNDLNPQFADRIQAFIVEEEDEIWWVYPSTESTGELDKAAVYNLNTHTWSIRDAASVFWFYYLQFSGLTWNTMPDVSWDETVGNWNDRRLLSEFPLNLFGTDDGTVMQFGGVYSQNGAAYTKSAETKLYDMNRPDIKKRLERVEVAVDRALTGTLNVYVGHCNAPGDAITYSGPFPLNMASGSGFFPCDITDIFFDLKFETTGSGDPFSVFEFKLWYKERTQQ